MAIVNGEAHFVVNADLGRKLLSETKTYTIESLADDIHAAFCERTMAGRAFAGVAGELHRRQHIEIARMIFEKGA